MTDETFPTAPDLYQRYRHRTKKHFGQHFLTNPSILDQIVGFGDVAGTNVLEIGPGCGTLTTTLLAAGANVTAVEIDSDASDFLEETLVPCGLRLIRADALTVDFDDLLADGDRRWRCVANLPYNVATPLTLRLLAQPKLDRMALMYQREVANRICATPKTSAYGSLTVAVAWRSSVKSVMTLSPGAFTPPPKVTSSVVLFERHSVIPHDETTLKELEKRVQAGFAQRRKTLVNTLGSIYSKDRVKEALAQLSISVNARAEELSPDQWMLLASLF